MGPWVVLMRILLHRWELPDGGGMFLGVPLTWTRGAEVGPPSAFL